MGEAIITRGCYGGGDSEGGCADSAIITQNCNYFVGKTGNYRIMAIGPGGKGAMGNRNSTTNIICGGAGGGSGYTNIKTVLLNKDTMINCIVGDNAYERTTTVFGTYVSAAAGSNATWSTSAGSGYSNGNLATSVNGSVTKYSNGGAGGAIWYNNSNVFDIRKNNAAGYSMFNYGRGSCGYTYEWSSGWSQTFNNIPWNASISECGAIFVSFID